nr:Heat shock factor-binding protein 1 [Ipomoea batatas]
MTVFVQNLLQQMQTRFQAMSESIISKNILFHGLLFILYHLFLIYLLHSCISFLDQLFHAFPLVSNTSYTKCMFHLKENKNIQGCENELSCLGPFGMQD